MEIEWEEPFHESRSTVTERGETAVDTISVRLDLLMPLDQETGGVAPGPARTYINAMMDLASRQNKSVSLIAIQPDSTPLLEFLGSESNQAIGFAMVRYLQQETRPYDMVARFKQPVENGMPAFLVICPFLEEEEANSLALRLQTGLTAKTGGEKSAWLSVSIGVTSFSLDASDSDSILARVRDALRRAKRHGGNCIWRYTDTLRSLIEREKDTPDSN